MTTLTPKTPVRLALYRSAHVIRTVRDWDDDLRRGYVFRCVTCRIEVHMQNGGRWRHSAAEIGELAKIERGEL
jgi:hypothetical protein